MVAYTRGWVYNPGVGAARAPVDRDETGPRPAHSVSDIQETSKASVPRRPEVVIVESADRRSSCEKPPERRRESARDASDVRWTTHTDAGWEGGRGDGRMAVVVL